MLRYRREPARGHFPAEETTAGIGAMLGGDLLGRTAVDRGHRYHRSGQQVFLFIRRAASSRVRISPSVLFFGQWPKHGIPWYGVAIARCSPERHITEVE